MTLPDLTHLEPSSWLFPTYLDLSLSSRNCECPSNTLHNSVVAGLRYWSWCSGLFSHDFSSCTWARLCLLLISHHLDGGVCHGWVYSQCHLCVFCTTVERQSRRPRRECFSVHLPRMGAAIATKSEFGERVSGTLLRSDRIATDGDFALLALFLQGVTTWLKKRRVEMEERGLLLGERDVS